MKKTWSYLVLAVVAISGVISILATTSPPPPYFIVATANNEGIPYYNSGEKAFACLQEQIRLEWGISEEDTVTLTANPLGQLNPDLDKKQVGRYGNLATQILGITTITLESASFKGSVALELLSEDICKNFPVNLIANFSGTLQQTSPTTASLNRALKLRWRDNALQVILTTGPTSQQTEDYAEKQIAPCQLFPNEDKLICSAGDEANPRLRLEGIVTADSFTGTYKGFDESTAGTISFEGTFDFKKVEPQAQPQ
jgi:hypothetical protein